MTLPGSRDNTLAIPGAFAYNDHAAGRNRRTGSAARDRGGRAAVPNHETGGFFASGTHPPFHGFRSEPFRYGRLCGEPRGSPVLCPVC